MSAPAFNAHGVWAIYKFELSRSLRTIWQSLATPVITTSLYFVVFGGAIGSRMGEIDGVTYGAFIVPGLIMLTLFTDPMGHQMLAGAVIMQIVGALVIRKIVNIKV